MAYDSSLQCYDALHHPPGDRGQILPGSMAFVRNEILIFSPLDSQ